MERIGIYYIIYDELCSFCCLHIAFVFCIIVCSAALPCLHGVRINYIITTQLSYVEIICAWWGDVNAVLYNAVEGIRVLCFLLFYLSCGIYDPSRWPHVLCWRSRHSVDIIQFNYKSGYLLNIRVHYNTYVGQSCQ